MSVSVGLQDIVFQNSESESGLSLSPEQLSFFVVVSSAKQLGSYHLQTFLGFGTGGLALKILCRLQIQLVHQQAYLLDFI